MHEDRLSYSHGRQEHLSVGFRPETKEQLEATLDTRTETFSAMSGVQIPPHNKSQVIEQMIITRLSAITYACPKLGYSII